MSGLSNVLLEPLAHGFMQRALVLAVLIGATCAVLSCFLVLRGWSLMGDAISHAVLPGVVAAYALGLPIALGAFLAGLGSAILTGYLAASSRVKADTVLGIVLSGMFALGLVMLVKVPSDVDLMHILFGNILGLDEADLWESGLIAAATLAIVLARRRDLLALSFDEKHATAIGLPVRTLHYGLLALLALTVVAALKAVGVILVVAMLIVPGATGFLLARRFDAMLKVAAAVAILSSVAGTYVSFFADVATGPAIVTIQAGLFTLAAVGAHVRTQRLIAAGGVRPQADPAAPGDGGIRR
jgi:manganese/iron transport system permease protein